MIVLCKRPHAGCLSHTLDLPVPTPDFSSSSAASKIIEASTRSAAELG
jgi:hypothetical protein